MADRPLFIRLSMPSGLEDALEGLAREILRHQPKDMYEFSAQYFEGLLRQRNKEMGMPEDDVYGLSRYVDEELPDLNDPEYEKAATKIQAGFRGSKARKEVVAMRQQNVEEDDEDMSVDQHIEESSKTAIQIQMPTEEEEEVAEGTQGEEEIDIDLDDPEVEMAATKIQAGFKGMKTRKEMKQKKEQQYSHQIPTIEIDLDDPEVNLAATKIQAGYKGMKTRKELKESTKHDDAAFDEEIVDEAATVIQSGYYSMKAREDMGESEDNLYFDPNDPELNQAASKIQAGFKGHRTRKEMDKIKAKKLQEVVEEEEENEGEELEIDIDPDDPEAQLAASKIQAGFRGMKTRKELKIKVNTGKTSEVQEDEIDIDLEDPDVEAAATKIQASFKGMRTRKEVKKMKEKQTEAEAPEVLEEPSETEIDIDLGDPEVEMAATKIQAGYKGMRTRKELKKKTYDSEIVKVAADSEIEIDLDDPDVNLAATKIQAGYKGMKTRKEMRQNQLTLNKNDHDQEEAEGNDKDECDDHTEEIIDIDLTDPEVEMAATKIQAGFKGMKTRQELSLKKAALGDDSQKTASQGEEVDIDLDDPEVNAAAIKIQAGYKGMQTRRELKKHNMNYQDAVDPTEVDVKTQINQDKEIDIDLNDPEVEMAATKIQAGFKGMKTRKEIRAQKGEGYECKPMTDDVGSELKDEENIDIDLEDPDVNQAAVKIQAGYKGMKTRKELRSKKDVDQEATEEIQANEDEEIDIDLEDPEVNKAATKIQAGYKGMKTRKELRSAKEGSAIEIASKIEEEMPIGPEDDEINIDPDDPEANLAATKIQASYKGMKTRKELKAKQSNNTTLPLLRRDEIDETDIVVSEEAAPEEPENEQSAYEKAVPEEVPSAYAELEELVSNEVAQEEATPEEAAPGEVPPDKAAPEETSPDEGAPEEAAPEEAAPEEAAPEEAALEEAAPEEAAPEEAAPEDGTPLEAAPEDGTPLEAAPEDGTTLEAAPEEAGPEVAAPEEATPEDGAPEDGKPQKVAVVEAIPEEAPAEDAAPEVEIHEEAAQVEAEPETTSPEDAAPEEAVLVEAAQEEAEPEEATPEEATPDEASIEGGAPEETSPEEEAPKDVAPEEQAPEDAEQLEGQQDEALPEKAVTDLETAFDETKPGEVAETAQKELVPEEITTEMLIEGAGELQDQDIQQQSHAEDDGYNSPEFTATTASSMQGSPIKSMNLELTGTAALLHDPNDDIIMTMVSQESITDSDMIDECSDVTQEDRCFNFGAPEALDENEEDGGSMLSSLLTVAAAEDYNQVPENHEPDFETNYDDIVSDRNCAIDEGGAVPFFEGGGEQTEYPKEDAPEEEASGVINPNSVSIGNCVQAAPEPASDGLDEISNITLDGARPQNDTAVSSTTETIVDSEDVITGAHDTLIVASEGEEATALDDQSDSEKPCTFEVMNIDSNQALVQSAKSIEIEDQIFQELKKSHESDLVVEESAHSVQEVGAVPFKLYSGHPQAKTNHPKSNEEITLYFNRGSYCSEKVLIYLHEKGLEFMPFHIDLSKGEQFSKWFLKISPKGEVPVLTIRDISKDTSDPRHLRAITESTRIIHSLETKYGDDLPSPRLVPLVQDTTSYQLHVYFTAIFDQIPLNIISHGLAFHDHLAIEPEPPYIHENYDAIKEMVLNRSSVLMDAADDYANFIGSDTDAAVVELRKKANIHKTSMDQYMNFTEYKKLLKKTSSALDKVEAQLKKTMSGNTEDDCDGWLLGSGFSAVDITLGVFLHRLAKLGLRHYYWSHGKRPYTHKFMRQMVFRQSFAKSVSRLPISEISGPKPKLMTDSSLESRISLDEMEVYVQMEKSDFREKKIPPLRVTAKSKESMEVFNEIQEAHATDEKEDNAVYKTLKTHLEEDEGPVTQQRTSWKQLWVSDEEEEK